jgi:hypothetical protein
LARVLIVPVLVAGGLLFMAGASAATPAPSPVGDTYICNGSDTGVIPPGTYNSMVIKGVCYMTYGTVNVLGNLTVAPGGLLDAAATPGDPTDNPILPATVLVGGNVYVGAGAVLTIGCSPAGGCHGVDYDRIGGSLTAIDAQGVLVQHVSIGGSASVLGGGGGAAGGASSGECFALPSPNPWGEDAALSQGQNGTPQYTDFEDSTIGGSLSVIGVQTCWIGSFRDQVAGNVTFAGDVTSDADGNELGANVIGGSMTCLANQPQVQFGDSFATPNIVGGLGLGECAFSATQVNPVANPDNGQDSPPFYPAGPPVHISVSARTLGTYDGTHIVTSSNSLTSMLEPNVTASGDTLVASLNSAKLLGGGLTGTISAVFPPTNDAPLGSTGELVVATNSPGYPTSGSESFEASDMCTCSFDNQSGAVKIIVYGTTSHGFTTGSFIVASATATPPATSELENLAGYGTFSGEAGGPLHLVEHLRIT